MRVPHHRCGDRVIAVPPASSPDPAQRAPATTQPRPPARHDRRQLARAGATQIARARIALAPFATDLARAQAARLQAPDHADDARHGLPLHEPGRGGVRRPPPSDPRLRAPGQGAQLVAAEWVFPSKPAKPPLPGARYGSFAAACHYVDGTFTPADATRRRARRPALRAAPPSASGTPTS